MTDQGIDLVSLGVVAVTIICGIVAAAGELAFTLGIPIASLYWYRLNRTEGRFLFLIGFSICLAVRLVWRLFMWIRVFVGAAIGLVNFATWLFEPFGLAVALVGFIIIVMKEEKQA